MPLILNNGGPINSSPVLTSITFSNDPWADSVEAFLAKVGSSSYWSDALAEYGVGPATAAQPVHSKDVFPAQIQDSDVQAWLRSKLDGTHPEFGTPTENSIYVIYFPYGTSITENGRVSCQDDEAYHASTALFGGRRVSYVVIPRCDPKTGLGVLTTVTSHELAEAATDPFVDTDNKAYNGIFMAEHIWQSVAFGGEVADLCQIYPNTVYTPSDLGFAVEKIWSNKAALANSNPCGPNPPGQVYFNAVPMVSDVIGYNDSYGPAASMGVYIPVGASKTIELDLFSNGPTSGPWTLSAPETPQLSFSFDKVTGVNGDKVHLTIHVKSVDPTYNAEVFWVYSSLNGTSYGWPVVVGNVAQD